jgi:hypothetical protein
MKAMDTRLRARRAPFGLPAEGALGSGQEPTPEQSGRHYRNCHQEDLSHSRTANVAAVIEEIQLKYFNAKTETSSATDPATDFRHSQIMCFRSHSICAEQPIFADNLRLYITAFLQQEGYTNIRKVPGANEEEGSWATRTAGLSKSR